jgi:2-keto-4-pentenoate hydratase/2-oxohepta-3-ene-1,7-dioic acid hydratase in catechol pathway
LNETSILQDSNTSNMIHNIAAIISFLSQSMTLLPGTVILTGTPEGVGFTRQPPLFLKAGDQIAVEIEGIGRLSNPVIREQPPSS